MDLYILRHGEAQPRGIGVKEADRALTPRGRQDVKKVVAFARGAMDAPSVIMTSPYARAKQTAAIAMKAFPQARLVETANLLPNAKPDLLWKEIGAIKGARSVLVAGHEPHLSNFTRFVLEAAIAVDLKKGALMRIATKNHMGAPRGTIKWLLAPKLVR